MAEKVKIQVELESKLQQAKQITSNLTNQGGFKDNAKAAQQVALITQELDSLTKISNPTLKNLSRIEVLFNQLSEILLKVAQTTKATSDKFKQLESELSSLQLKENDLKKQRGEILKRGRVNKDTGKYELFDTYQTEIISQAHIKNKRGVDIKTKETFFKKFDSQTGMPVDDAFQDQNAAKKVYDQLLAAQTENAKSLQEINISLNNYRNKIEEKTKELERQGQSENNTAPGDIVANRTQVNRLIDSEKERIHSEEDQKKLASAVEGSTQAFQKQSSALGRAFKQFTIYNFAVKTVRGALNEARRTVQELDKYLTEQAMVTGKTREQTYKLVGSYQQLALQCGATTKEIASVATEYMKQGKTIEDSLVLTEAAVAAAKVARVSVGDSVNYLTTALNGFRLSTEDAMKVSDKFAAVAASSATDYDELAIALSKVASQANLAGMSIDYTTALLTKGLETTREAPETMGTALKTIIARMRELGDYGETLDDGMDINNVESQLKYVGIALRDQQGELRSTEEVLDELGKKWDILNKNQQAAIAKALAGTRQQSRLIAMMEDYERVTELQQISQRSAGATAAQAGVYLEGMEAALNNIQVAWEKIVMTLTNSEVVVSTVQVVGKLLDGIGESLKSTGKQVVLFTTLAAVGANIVGHKLRENHLVKEQHKIDLERAILAQEEEIREKESFITTSQQKLLNKQKDEMEIANNEVKIAQQAEYNALEQYNADLKAETAAASKAATAQEIADKWAKNEADAEAAVQQEKFYLWKMEQEAELAAEEAESISRQEQELQLEQELLKLELQRKALERELSPEEQARLQSIDAEIQASKAREKDAQKQSQLAKTRAEAAKKEVGYAEENLKKTQKTRRMIQGKADASKKELDTLKKTTSESKKQLDDAKKLSKTKQDALVTLQKDHEQQLLNNQAAVEKAKHLLQLDEANLQLLREQQGGLWSILGIWNNIKSVMLLFKPIYLGAIGLQKLLNKLKTDEVHIERRKQAQEAKGLKNKFISALYSMADSAAAIPVAGWIAAAAILALAGITIAVGIAHVKQQEYNKSAEGAAENINAISNEIYKLNESATAIDNITNSFDKLDNKLIKTKEDLEEMHSLLQQGTEIMNSDEVDDKDDVGYGKGVNEKEYYEGLSDEEKKLYLARKQEEINLNLERKRQEQKNIIAGLTTEEREKLLSDKGTSPAVIKAQSAIYALNNSEIYKNIDLLKESSALTTDAAQSLETMTQAMMENITASEAWEFTNDPHKIEVLTDALAKLETQAKNLQGEDVTLSAAEVLDSDDYSLKDRVEAYEQIRDELEALGDDYVSVLSGFNTEYSGFEKFADMSDGVLEFSENVGLSADKINDLWSAWEDLRKANVDITEEVWENNFAAYMEALAATQGDVLSATKQIFGDYLDDSEGALDAFISAYGDLVQVGILNMGQNMDRVKNSINNFYEKAIEWNTMSESDKAAFIEDNTDLFSGKNGEELRDAFESGNYNRIEKALSENQALKDQLKKRREEVRQELLIERDRDESNRNTAYIAELERYEEYLNDTENLFKASLEVRREQEQAQMDQYRSYLEKQQEALEDSLNKRKEAYENYFDKINQEEEDEEYEEQANLLISNLSKLGSSTNANSQQQVQEMEQQLEELEAERLKELRERAQEAVLENMDDELQEISDKFDKLLESNHALLLAMQGELDNPADFLSNMIAKELSTGATSLDMEQYVEDLKTSFDSILGDSVDWEILKEEIHQLFLNVNGQTINLNEEEEQNIYDAVEKALTQIGKR